MPIIIIIQMKYLNNVIKFYFILPLITFCTNNKYTDSEPHRTHFCLIKRASIMAARGKKRQTNEWHKYTTKPNRNSKIRERKKYQNQ